MVVASAWALRPCPLKATRVSEGPIQWYDRQLRVAPIRTKAFSNGVVSAVGDFLAQMISTGHVDKTRCCAWYLSGLLYFGPLLHTWYNGLFKFESHMRENYGTSKFRVVMMMVAFNQFVGAALMNSFFLYFLAVAHMSLATVFDGALFSLPAALRFATEQWRTKFISMMLANWMFWPLPTVANLYIIPLHYRVLFSNTCSIIWKCLLSLTISH